MAVSTVQLVQLSDRNVQLLMAVLRGMQKSHQVSSPFRYEVVIDCQLIGIKSEQNH